MMLTTQIQFLVQAGILFGVCYSMMGPCPQAELTSVPDFSPADFQGVWHIAFQSFMKYLPCQIFNFTQRDDMNLNFTAVVNITQTITIKAYGTAYTINPENQALMHWEWSILSAKADRVMVLDVDYAKHAVLHICNEFDVFHQPASLILSREKTLSEEDLMAGKEVLRQNGMKVDEVKSPKCEITNNADNKVIDVKETVHQIAKFFDKFL